MTENKDKILRDWIKFLNPNEVKFQLTIASLYLTSYEFLIESIVQKTKDFYTNGFKNGEVIRILGKTFVQFSISHFSNSLIIGYDLSSRSSLIL